MKEVADGIYRLGSKYHNWYLIGEGGKYTGVDAGCSREWSEMASALEKLGATTDDLEAVIISHGHIDHTGFARDASERGVNVKIHADDEYRLAQTRDGYAASITDLPLWRPRVIAFLAVLGRAGALTSHKLAGAETFADDDVLDVPGRPRVVHTPGHTEGHSAFYLEDRRLVFTGDAFVSIDMIGSQDGPQLMPDVFHTDVAQAQDSLGRLAALDADLALPGHGDPMRGRLSDLIAGV